MGARSLLPDDIERYVGETIAKETPVQKRLRAETARAPVEVSRFARTGRS